MIKLNVEEYCHECEGFEPERVDTGYYLSFNEIINVECRYKRRCAAMYRHLEKKFKANKGANNAEEDYHDKG